MSQSKNVLGGLLITCSANPITGYFRDGCCNTDENDQGQHTVCALMTREFLEFSVLRGNDLVTPRPEWNFPGLKPGDFWCVCVLRWLEAFKAGCAPPVRLEATHEAALKFVRLEDLKSNACPPGVGPKGTTGPWQTLPTPNPEWN